MTTTTALPEGLRWDTERKRLKICRPDLAHIVLHDPHMVTGIDHGRGPGPVRHPTEGETPSVYDFFQMWYTVGDRYAEFNTELRKAFTVRVVSAFEPMFDRLARCTAAALPPTGDLAREYLSPYFMNSTFAMMGVPERDWPNLTKVAKFVIHLFKQQLRGVGEHPPEQVRTFATLMRYLKSLTDRMLAGTTETPLLRAARALSQRDGDSWPIAALIGQLLMAGIEPMMVGCAVACRTVWSDAELRASLYAGTTDAKAVTEEAMRQLPPFSHIFRFVAAPCDCLGTRLDPGTVVAVDIGSVNLATHAADTAREGCPVRSREVLTFGGGQHYCLGASSARIQVAAALCGLIRGRPQLSIDPDAVRLDGFNNLTQVLAMPYTTSGNGDPA